MVVALVVALLLVFFLAPVVSVQRDLKVSPTITVNVQDRASMSYYLLGVGTAPFAGSHVYRTKVNGTAVEVWVTENGWNASVGALPLSQAPMANLHLQLLLNTTQFSGATFSVRLTNIGNQNITLLGVNASFIPGPTAKAVNIAPNETTTISFTVYGTGPAHTTAGDTYPVTISGQIVNGSAFTYYGASVTASNS